MKQSSGRIKHDAGRQPSASKGKRRGFTLIELLVVIAIIAILAALQIPVLARTKSNAQGISCLSNMRQLQMAALLYAYNSNDFLPANVQWGGDSATRFPNWVDGIFSSAANGGLQENPVGCATNPFFLGVQGQTGTFNGTPYTLLGSIGPYARAAGIYHCPTDKYLDPTWHMLRVRSCSMNAWTDGSGAGGASSASYKVFIKISDFGGRLAASDCFMFLDENPLSLNDGWFLYHAGGNPPAVNDEPAVNHGRYTSFSFADGHAEPHEWHDAFLQTLPPGSAGGTDTMWLTQHGTYALQ